MRFEFYGHVRLCYVCHSDYLVRLSYVAMTTLWSEDAIFARVKRALLANSGVSGIKGAINAFRDMDRNTDGSLSREELRDGLAAKGVNLSGSELTYLVRAFDKNRDGRVSVEEFTSELINSIPKRRLQLIDDVYQVMIAQCGDPLPAADVLRRMDLSRHPSVLNGAAKLEDIDQEFRSGFDGNQDGSIDQDEWKAFWAGVSFTMPDDDVFEVFVLEALDADNRAAPRLLNTQLKMGTLQRSHQVEVDDAKQSFGSATAKQYATEGLFRNKYNRPQDPLPSVRPDYVTTMQRSYPHPSLDQTKASLPKKDVSSATGDPLVDGIRRKILQRVGADGFVGLQRSFRTMDTNRDQQLDKAELATGLQRIGITLTPAELAVVMKRCDRSGNGTVSVGEFCRVVRGPVRSQARINILLEAFQRLDQSGDGVVSINELQSKYDTSRHPAVVGGRKTAEQVLIEFISDWDQNRDGKVTAEEWMDYYANISATIDNDQYFELMIRNAWHISGGKGAAQNTSCRRVLATFSDGRQRVLEIENDIGLRSDDIAGMLARLQSQGHRGIVEIKLHF